MKTGVEMGVWAYKIIEKSSPKGRFSSSQEFDYSLYHIVPGTFDCLDELIEFLKTETPGLRWERDNEIIHRLELAPDAWEAIFRCWKKDPGLYFYIALGRASCWCRHCRCDAPATQHDLNGDPRCDECEDIGVKRFERFCLRQTKNGRRCPKCGDDIRWEAVIKIQDSQADIERIQAGTCGCERREWRRSWGVEPDDPFLGVKELPVLEWEEVPPQDRDPEDRTDQEWRSGYPRAEYVCSHGTLLRLGVGFELVHFRPDPGSTHEPGWCLRAHMEQCRRISHWVDSREEGELLASRIKVWGYDGILGCVCFLQRDEG